MHFDKDFAMDEIAPHWEILRFGSVAVGYSRAFPTQKNPREIPLLARITSKVSAYSQDLSV